MEQLPTWLAAAVVAAGVSTVYNSEDWDRLAEAQAPHAEPASPAPAPQTH